MTAKDVVVIILSSVLSATAGLALFETIHRIVVSRQQHPPAAAPMRRAV